jgi:hypothetical protein
MTVLQQLARSNDTERLRFAMTRRRIDSAPVNGDPGPHPSVTIAEPVRPAQYQS